MNIEDLKIGDVLREGDLMQQHGYVSWGPIFDDWRGKTIGHGMFNYSFRRPIASGQGHVPINVEPLSQNERAAIHADLLRCDERMAKYSPEQRAELERQFRESNSTKHESNEKDPRTKN